MSSNLIPIAVTGAAVLTGTAIFLYLRREEKLDDSAFLEAARAGEIKIIESLASRFKSVDELRDPENGDSALMIAISQDNISVALKLLSLGASVSITNNHQFTPLHTACFYQADIKIIRALIEQGASIEACDHNGWVPLHVAISKGDLKVSQLLVETGADINATTSHGETPLLIASNNGSLDCVEYLLQHKANPMIRRVKTMDSPLILAVWNGRKEVAQKLIEAEPQLLSLPMSDGAVPIHVAAGVGNLEMLKLLVETFKCDVNLTKRDGSNALHVAMGSDTPNLDVVTALLQMKCSLEAKDRFGCTALHRACLKKQVPFIKLFLEAGASPHLTDSDGLTPLHSMCSSTSKDHPIADETVVEVFKEFLKYGADLGATDRAGATVLHYAVCRTTNRVLIEFLLKTQPSLAFQADRSERTPLHLVCKMYKNPTIRKILEDHMKSENPEFFDSFDPNHRVEIDKKVITSNLEEGERFAVLDGDVSLAGIAKKLKNGHIKKVIVLTGAGISTSCGIADFRGEKGIYKNSDLKEKYGIAPNQMFSLSTLHSSPKVFYAAIKDLFLPVIKGKYTPSAAHKFIAWLDKEGLLVRNFTQNIDTLETKAGVRPEKLVEAHGSFARAVCLHCGSKSQDMQQFWNAIENDLLPSCQRCSTKEKQCLVQPDIVLFGQGLPQNFFDSQDELKDCDLLIVMGTSLQVYPFASLVNYVPENCPRLVHPWFDALSHPNSSSTKKQLGHLQMVSNKELIKMELSSRLTVGCLEHIEMLPSWETLIQL